MDLRMLSFGKLDEYPPYQASTDLPYTPIHSSCYFDWISFDKISEADKKTISEGEPSISKKVFAYDDFLKLHPTNNQYHLQEKMILVSDDIDDTSFDNLSCIYISMINIPIYNEKEVLNSNKSYSDLKEATARKIKTIISRSPCRLYYTFDHCDYVLIADGSKMAFGDFISLLKKIRQFTYSDKFLTIHDINTIYGYTQNYFDGQILQNNENQKIDLMVKLSFRLPNLEKTLIDEFSQKTHIPDMVFETIGRYDCFMIWKNISLSVFNDIVNIVRHNKEDYFTYCIQMGINENTLMQEGDYKQSTSILYDLISNKFQNEINKLTCSPFVSLSYLVNALNEVNRSICTMMKNGFAQYYILTFCESFYSFLEFLIREQKHIQEMSGTLSYEIKRKTEKIYDMYSKYFTFLNDLNACTMHNDRQFLQIDSYQMFYFDAPPKLIAFYTAIANKIAGLMEADTHNQYTFLITPDFKEDIYVESITNDRTMNREHNILIIHINEKNMYDVVSTIRIITHEICHHVGQSVNLRRTRAKAYLKCCVAFMVADVFNSDMLGSQQEENSDTYHLDAYKMYTKIIDGLFDSLFPSDKFLFDEGWLRENGYIDENNCFKHSNERDSDVIPEFLYYAEYLTQTFIQYCIDEFLKSDQPNSKIEKVIQSAFKKPFIGFLDNHLQKCQLFHHESNQENNNSVFVEFVNKKLSRYIYVKIKNWVIQHNTVKDFELIAHVFSESFADACMLNLVFDKEDENTLSDYIDMLFNHDASQKITTDDILRMMCILKFLGADPDSYPDGVKYLDTKRLFETYVTEDVTDMYTNGLDNFFHNYIIEQVKGYIGNIHNLDRELRDTNNKCSKEAVQLMEYITTLNSPCNEISKMVNLMDQEIFEYRLRLYELYKNETFDLT